MPSLISVRIGFGIDGTGGGASAGLPGAFFDDKLLRRLALRALSPDVDDARSRFAFFLSELNAFLKRWLLDTPFFLSLPGTLKLEAVVGRDDGRCNSVSGLDPARSEVAPLIADSASPCAPSVSLASAELALIKGEDDV